MSVSDRIQHFPMCGKGQPLKTWDKHPMVEFFRFNKERVNFKDTCLFCGEPATLVADLGSSEFPCCDNLKCMEQAAEEVWERNCDDANKRGFKITDKGIAKYIMQMQAELRKYLKKGAKKSKVIVITLRLRADDTDTN